MSDASVTPVPVPAETDETPEVINLAQSSAGDIHAEMVRMHQSAAQAITADDVEMNMAAAASSQVQKVTAQQSAFGAVFAEEANISGSMIGAVLSDSARAHGVIAAVNADTVHVENAYVGVTAASEVRGERVESIVMLAGRVEGEVHTVVDTRGAILAGVVGGMVAGLILLVGKMAFRRE